MPDFTNLRWERAPEGWELWGIRRFDDFTQYEGIELAAWVYENHAKQKWHAKVYATELGAYQDDADLEFDTLEDAQAWCWTCVRTS